MTKRKKTVSVADLRVLVKKGWRFDRATLNAMLDKVAELKPVKTFPVYRATCYVRFAPPAKYGEYICPKCGARTYYLSCETPTKIAPFQEWAKKLRGLGLDITVDESAFCSICSKDTKLKTKTLPTQGRLKKIGKTVGIAGMTDKGEICIDAADIDALWIPAEYVDAGETVLEGGVDVHLRNSKGADLVISARGTLVVDGPARPGDDPAWVRVRIPLPDAGQFPFRGTELIVDAEDITVTKAESVVYEEPAVYWVINGKRTEAERADFYILSAFLKKQKGISRYANYGRRLPIQTALPRLRKLLGIMVKW
jgi:predicted RNA-binding Zn-ribbon protein involved in translation (DUF1610 family)